MAITILNIGGVHFKDLDLRGIKIDGAELSYSKFLNTDLSGSSLRNVNFELAIINACSLNSACLAGIRFG